MKNTQSKTAALIVIIVVAVIAVTAVAYYAMNNNQQGNGTNNPGDSPLQIQGAALYQEKCSGCHNPLDSSTKRGHSASEIQEAINNVAPMKKLSDLTTEEIQAIAEALKP